MVFGLSALGVMAVLFLSAGVLLFGFTYRPVWFLGASWGLFVVADALIAGAIVFIGILLFISTGVLRYG